MKKIFAYISGIAFMAIIWLIIPHTLAQSSTATISVDAGITNGCQWSGVEWNSNLTVPDNEICVIQGTGRTAVDVTISADTDNNGTPGKLIVGSNNVDTDFTLSGNMHAYGAVEIGNALGNVSYDSELIITSGNLFIGDTTSTHYASVTVLSNSSGNNNISIGNYIYIGNSSNSNARLTISDSGTANSAKNISVYGSGTDFLGNGQGISNFAGQIDCTNSIILYNSGEINNDATITSPYLWTNNTSTIDNSGTITVSTEIHETGSSTITNSGTFNSTGGIMNTTDTATFTNTTTGTLTVPNGLLEVYNDSSVTNDGSMTIQTLEVGYSSAPFLGGTFTNSANGTLTVTSSTELYRGSLTNNNTGSSISMDFAGGIDIRGTTGDTSQLTNSGVVQHTGDLNIYEYGKLLLKPGSGNGRWVQPGSRYNTLTRSGSSDDPGEIEIETGAVYSAFFTYVGQNGGTYKGKIINNGTIERIDINGNQTTDATLFYMYNDSTIDNYGTINRRAGQLYMYNNAVFTNYSTGTTADTNNTYVYDSSIYNNHGYVTSNQIFVGNNNDDGGTFNNYSITPFGVNLTTTGTLTIRRDGVFTNKTDAEISIHDVNLGWAGTVSKFVQDERTSNTNTKATVTTNFQINDLGEADIYDTISISTVSIATDGAFKQIAGTTASNSVTNSTGSISLNGSLAIDAGTTFNNSSTTSVNPTGHITNNGTFNSTNTGSTPFQVVGGIVESSSSSSFTLKGAPGLITRFSTNTPQVEIAGTINADATLGNSSYKLENGVVCLGTATWNVDGGGNNTDIASCANSSNNLTLAGVYIQATSSHNMTVYISNNTEVQGDVTVLSNNGTTLLEHDHHLQITNNGHLTVTGVNATLTSDGELDIQGGGEGNHGYLWVDNGATANLNYTGSNYDIGSIQMQSAWSPNGATTINLASGATLNLNDYETCSSHQCAIYINQNSYTDNSVFNINGTLNISSASSSPRYIYLGYGSTTYGTGEINVGTTGSLTNSTTGDLTIDKSGKLEVADDSNSDTDVSLGGHLIVNGKINDGTGDRGAYIGGQLTCTSLLDVQSEGYMDIGSNGVVTVSGSTTTVSGDMELDGTLNAGDLTVTSTGHIHSGDGSPTTTGTGTSTNFLINAGDVTVNSGGKIASDGVSTKSTSAGAGSYGGEAEGKSGGGNTYGKSKLDETDAPLYGEGGATGGGVSDALGGGGVRIYATGDIDVDGEISSDGNDSSDTNGGSGAGGTVIIVQDPTLDTATFTGTGEITANGGGSSTSGVPVGGGGRIVIESPLFDDPDYSSYGFGNDGGTISAYGGANTADSDYAASGTIVYLGDENNDNTSSTVYGTLIVDQNSTPATSSEVTEIPNTGNIEFARVEARNGAKITFATDPTNDPITCYANDGGSTVTYTSRNCRANPDKPDTLFINDSYEGAQTRAETSTGAEPSVGNPITGLYDLTPVFSVIYRNVEDPTSSVDKVLIQVDDSSDFSSPLWNTIITLQTPVTNGQRTENIEYNSDSTGSALSTGTTYYVRMAFEDTTDTYAGLWTHRDIGQFYQYDLDGNMLITDNCSGSIQIEDDVPDGAGGSLSDTNGNRYGNGSCDLTVTSTYGYWSVLFGKQSGETAFDDAGATNDIDELTGCNIVTDGGATSDEEYGYNITTNTSNADSTIINNHVETDTTCSQPYNNWTQSTGNYIFNVEANGSEDEIIRVDDNNPVSNGNGTFTLNMHASVDSTTALTDYALGVWTIITTNP